MPSLLHIRDESATGQPLSELAIELLSERITVRELIRSRVYQEVKDINVRLAQNAAHAFHSLIQPAEAERALNGYRLRRPRELDWRKQYDIAVQAFERSGFLILVDDRQVGGLDDEIDLRSGTRVSFVRLVPLVGG